MSDKLTELAKHCEQAEGPDRSIDGLIAHAIGCTMPDDPAGWPPRYTASIDAALTLVPKGFRWRLGYSRHVPCNAELIDYRPQMEPNLGRFDGETDSNHALALCAAALRAHAAQHAEQ